MRRHEDHRVVRRAASERGRARIEHAAARGVELRIERLARGIAVVLHVEIPAHGRVLARERVEARHGVVVGQPLGGRLERIAARLDEEDAHAFLGEARRQRAAARARADDDIVPLLPMRLSRVIAGCFGGAHEHGQNVFTKAMSARLSSSLSSGSVPNDRSSVLRSCCRLNSAVPK